MMRSVFDQYKQPDNQLTHSLVCALGEDSDLLKRFIKEIAGAESPSKPLQIIEQQLPGEELICSEEEAERRGLPDACIHDGKSWALLIECKVMASLKKDQLRRHSSTAARRGFTDIHILVIGIKQPKFSLPNTKFHAWTEIYKWLRKQNSSEWAKRVAEYMEIWEAKMTEYLTDGNITEFNGIPFGDKEPYNYIRAKRILKLAMDNLRKCKILERDLAMDPSSVGRGNIKGTSGTSVCDYLPIKVLDPGKAFTTAPHLTLSIKDDCVNALVIVPNAIRPVFRKNILGLGYDGFINLMIHLNRNLNKALRGASGAAPCVIVLQRRYPNQKSVPIIDAMLQYDLRTAFPCSANKKVVKTQSQWLTATYDALKHKNSNLQVAVGAIFPYKNCKAQKDAKILDYIADTWLACKPLLDAMIKD